MTLRQDTHITGLRPAAVSDVGVMLLYIRLRAIYSSVNAQSRFSTLIVYGHFNENIDWNS